MSHVFILPLDHRRDQCWRKIFCLFILLLVSCRLDRNESATNTWSDCVFVSSFTPQILVRERSCDANFVKSLKENRDGTFRSKIPPPSKTRLLNHHLTSHSEFPSSVPLKKGPAPTDWVIVEQYPMVPSDGIDPYHILDNNIRGIVANNGNNDGTEKFLNTLERLNVTANNLTLPIALMGIDSSRYPSLSNARKACRQGKIALYSTTTTKPSPPSSGQFRKGLVGDRVHPQDFIARRELYKNIQINVSSSPLASTSYNTLGDGFVKSKFQNLPIAYEDDYMAIIVKPAGLLIHPQGKNGSWGRKNNVLNALPYFLRRPSAIGSTKANNEEEEEDRTILDKPVPVHRLDFATSGLLVTAKTKGASRLLSQEFEYRKAQKTYTAMVYGIPVDNGYCDNNDSPLELPSFFGPKDQDASAIGNNTTGAIKDSIVDNGNTLDDEGSMEDDDCNWEGWNLGNCLLDAKLATTRWRLLGSHNCSVPIQYHHDNETVTTGTASIPISIVEMKPKTGRYHQLRRTMSWLYKTPIVGDPIYGTNFVEKNFLPQNAQLIEQKQMRDYSASLMLCSNEVDVAHPYFNTAAGRIEWETMDRTNKFRETNSGNKKTKKPPTSSSMTSSSLYEATDGVVRVAASTELPKKFTKFINMMERKKKQAAAKGNEE